MKKLALILPLVLLLAAGCRSKSSVNTETNLPATPPQSSSKLDSTLDSLNQSVAAEEQLSTQSDTDIVTSDKDVIINGSQEVSNATN